MWKAYRNLFKVKLEILRNSSTSFRQCFLAFLYLYHSNCVQIAAVNNTKMVSSYVKGCSNLSRLNKKVSYDKIPGKKKKKDAQIKTIERSALPKAIHVCFAHCMEDYFNESQELSRFFLKYLLKPDAVSFIFANGKVGNKAE